MAEKNLAVVRQPCFGITQISHSCGNFSQLIVLQLLNSVDVVSIIVELEDLDINNASFAIADNIVPFPSVGAWAVDIATRR